MWLSQRLLPSTTLAPRLLFQSASQQRRFLLRLSFWTAVKMQWYVQSNGLAWIFLTFRNRNCQFFLLCVSFSGSVPCFGDKEAIIQLFNFVSLFRNKSSIPRPQTKMECIWCLHMERCPGDRLLLAHTCTLQSQKCLKKGKKKMKIKTLTVTSWQDLLFLTNSCKRPNQLACPPALTRHGPSLTPWSAHSLAPEEQDAGEMWMRWDTDTACPGGSRRLC